MRLANNLSGFANLAKFASVTLLLSGLCVAPSLAQQAGQKTFSSPQEASAALFQATKNNDEGTLLQVFGPDGKTIVSSGDQAEDTENRARFVKAYEQMSRLVKEPDGTVCLYIGDRNWPYPIPIVNKGNHWYFDTAAGKKEILYRRIGRNEMSAMKICEQLVAAQKEYFQQHGEYAQKIYSDAGKQNGLYWKAANGQPESPIGPLVAQAVTEGYATSQSAPPVPYRGYYFHVLTAQQNGQSYLSNGKMANGFAFVAYPALYRSSGVMAFIVDEDGVIYEKDLGKQTDTIAKSMKQYNPAAGWQKTDQEQQQAASEPPPK
ncbi:MAG: DUF2950 domain-containing protein [Candidatus Acidiferrum sp.]